MNFRIQITEDNGGVSLLREWWLSLGQSKKWWLTPIIIGLLLMKALVI
jgi:hypothetical protein